MILNAHLMKVLYNYIICGSSDGCGGDVWLQWCGDAGCGGDVWLQWWCSSGDAGCGGEVWLQWWCSIAVMLVVVGTYGCSGGVV